MDIYKFNLYTDSKGRAGIDVDPPYHVTGQFLSYIITIEKINVFREVLNRAKSTQEGGASYIDGYYEAHLDPVNNVAQIAIDHPDEERYCEMPLNDFLALSQQWCDFATSHPLIIPQHLPKSQYPAKNDSDS